MSDSVFSRCISAFLLIAFILVQGCRPEKTFPGPEIGGESALIPKTPEFILGPGDKVEITVYRNDDLKRTMQIELSGKITFPLVGDVQAAGLSIFELRDRIRDGLARFVVDPQVTVGVTSMQSQKIIVLGEVNNPGYFQAESVMTALEAISRAGGFTADGKQENVLLMRTGASKPTMLSLNLERMLKEGDISQNMVLQRGDIVYVPRTAIADVDRFFKHMSTIIQPLVLFETGIYVGQKIKRGSGDLSIGQ